MWLCLFPVQCFIKKTVEESECFGSFKTKLEKQLLKETNHQSKWTQKQVTFKKYLSGLHSFRENSKNPPSLI